VIERRRAPRLDLRCPIHYRLLNRPEEGRSVTDNVSARGARFSTVAWETLHPGDRLEIRLTVPATLGVAGSGGVDLMGRGRITRVEPGPEGERLEAGGVAVEFDSPLNLSTIL
jgi:hypothetical protein